MTRRTSLALIVALAMLGAACGTTAGSNPDTGAAEATTTSSAETTTVETSPATTDSTEATSTTETDTTETTSDGDSESEGTTTTVPRNDDLPSAEPIPSDDTVPAVVGEVPEAMMENVYSVAEAETGADRASMTVLRAQAVTWNDGSLGCPEPDVVYTQALIDGYWVELAVGDTVLDYRLGDKGAIKLCEGGGSAFVPRNDS